MPYNLERSSINVLEVLVGVVLASVGFTLEVLVLSAVVLAAAFFADDVPWSAESVSPLSVPPVIPPLPWKQGVNPIPLQDRSRRGLDKVRRIFWPRMSIYARRRFWHPCPF